MSEREVQRSNEQNAKQEIQRPTEQKVKQLDDEQLQEIAGGTLTKKIADTINR